MKDEAWGKLLCTFTKSELTRNWRIYEKVERETLSLLKKESAPSQAGSDLRNGVGPEVRERSQGRDKDRPVISRVVH